MNKLKLAVSLIGLLATSLPIFSVKAQEADVAQEADLQFGQPATSGGVCEVADSTTTEDNSAIAIILEDYHVESTGPLKRQNCVISVRVTLQPGFFIQRINFLYDGFADVPSKGQGQLLYSYSIGATGTPSSNGNRSNFGAGFSGLYQEEDSTVFGAAIACPTQTILGINSSLIARGKGTTVALDKVTAESPGRVTIIPIISRCPQQ